ncbi:helix-turn-helix domain-containing protein [Nocardiopsis sp. NPDC050513]|uniref:helix-turn-helix domain-containing protein n=1 Tax=Nocardiopsis sp. NPDC050513 TaxID=3364338 RepID=UPI003797DAB7
MGWSFFPFRGIREHASVEFRIGLPFLCWGEAPRPGPLLSAQGALSFFGPPRPPPRRKAGRVAVPPGAEAGRPDHRVRLSRERRPVPVAAPTREAGRMPPWLAAAVARIAEGQRERKDFGHPGDSGILLVFSGGLQWTSGGRAWFNEGVGNQKKKNISDIRFGQAIARARSKSGMTQLRVAGHLGYTKGFISQVECGWKRLDPSKVQDLDDLLSAGSRLVRLYEDLYAPERVDWQEQLHVLQAGAELIRQYSGVLVPGNFQTKDYARAVFEAGAPWMKEPDIEEKATIRTERAARVLDEDGPQYHAVLDDVVVLRPVAENRVMREQIDRLIALAISGRLQLQLYEWGTLPHAGPDGPFSLIASPSAPEVLHAESVYLGQTTDEPHMVRAFVTLFSRLQANARSVRASVDYLRRVRRKYEDDEGGLAQVELQRRGA